MSKYYLIHKCDKGLMDDPRFWGFVGVARTKRNAEEVIEACKSWLVRAAELSYNVDVGLLTKSIAEVSEVLGESPDRSVILPDLYGPNDTVYFCVEHEVLVLPDEVEPSLVARERVHYAGKHE